MSIKIGVIDSGWGGVIFSKYLWNAFPQVNFCVALDQKHFPYGQKSLQQIQDYVVASVQFVEKQGVQWVVIACNTASILVKELQREFPKLFFIDVISPAISLVSTLDLSQKRLLILMTQRTKDSKIYEEKILTQIEGISAEYRVCTELIELAERGWASTEEIQQQFIQAIDPYEKQHFHTLLACTHFYRFWKILQERNKNVTFLDVPSALIQMMRVNMPQIPGDAMGSLQVYTNKNGRTSLFDIQKEFSKKIHVEVIQW